MVAAGGDRVCVVAVLRNKRSRKRLDLRSAKEKEKSIADMDFVPREEFDAVKAMASKARSENERLEADRGFEAKLKAVQPRSPPHRQSCE